MEFFDNAKTVAKKAVEKGSALSEAAALKIKMINKRREISEEYKKLGAFVYKKLKTDSPAAQDEITAKIGASVDKIDVLMIQLAKFNYEYKAKMEQAKRDDTKHTEASKEFMESFNQAREEADEDYEEAIALAEEAKEIAEEMK